MPDDQDRSEALDDEMLPDEYPTNQPLAVDGWGDVRVEGVGRGGRRDPVVELVDQKADADP